MNSPKAAGEKSEDADASPLFDSDPILKGADPCEQQRLTQQWARMAFDHAPIGMGIFGLDYRLLRVNAALCAALGYTREALIGQSLVNLTHPDDIERALSLNRALLRGEIPRYNVEKRLLAKDGRLVWLAVTALVIRDRGKQPRHGLLMADDITERKTAEEALRRSEEGYRSFIANSSEGIWRFDTDHPINIRLPIDEQIELMFSDVYIAECNDAKARMHGYSYASELVGKKLGDLLLKSAPMNIAAVRKFIKNGYSLHRTETVESGRFGRVRYFTNSLTGSLELDCFVRAWGVQTDITEQKEAELQIETSRRQLRALASHLQAVREQERAEISREIHDELGQSLTALKINISWVNKKLNDTTNSHKREEMRERVKDSLKLLGDTINNVKNIASQLHPRLLDTFGIAAAIEWQCAEFERRTGITCRAELPDDDIDVSQAISTAAFRILQEAMTNVARHSKATLITVRFKIDEQKLRLSIKDNGRGVTKAELLAINSLGLLGMRERALSLGGNVEINGDPETGTIVDVCIPLEPKAPQEKEAVQ